MSPNSVAANDVPDESTKSLLQGIWGHLSERRRLQCALLLIVILASGIAEAISLGSVIPFLSALSDPNRLWRQPLVQSLANSLGIFEAMELILPATLFFIVAIVLASSIRMLNLWLNGRIAASIGSDLSCEAYRHTLYQPYSFHLELSSSTAITSITSHTDRTVIALFQILQLVTAFVLAVCLLISLVLINWAIALSAILILGSIYGILSISVKNKLRFNSHKIAAASKWKIKSIQEGLGAIRDVLLESSQHTFVEVYRKGDSSERLLLAQNRFLTVFPRYVVEALGVTCIALYGFLKVISQGSGADILPLIGAVALGAQRLLPAIQQIYRGYSSLKGFSADFSSVLSMLSLPLPDQLLVSKPFPLRQNICLDSVSFRYEKDQPLILNELDLEIRRGERIGLIGSTGSGKSTTVDILMGLLQPTSGKLIVDGVDLFDPKHRHLLLAWRSGIAHVPQNIYLADSSIAENIAFGYRKQDIDFDRVKLAAHQSQIHDFIDSIPDGYNSFVGERGVRISGGQRQRIGIARALYKNAQVLVLDEATSALDTETESLVMNSIENLSLDLTVIMIAHRLSTLKSCDRIIDLS